MAVLPAPFSVKLRPTAFIPTTTMAPISTGQKIKHQHIRFNPIIHTNNTIQNAAVLQEFSLSYNKIQLGKRNPLRLEEEIESAIFRLQAVAERVVEFETERFLSKVSGKMSNEGRETVEETSREIMRKFLERPIGYLRSCDGCSAEKLRAVEIVIDGLAGKLYHGSGGREEKGKRSQEAKAC